MAKKIYEEANIAAIADKIREKTGGEATYTTTEMASGIDEVYEAGYNAGKISDSYNDGYEAGRNAEWSDMWDNIQENGNRIIMEKGRYSGKICT